LASPIGREDFIQFNFLKFLGQKVGKKCKFCQGNGQFEGTIERENQLESS
jgi:hypothetical protein